MVEFLYRSLFVTCSVLGRVLLECTEANGYLSIHVELTEYIVERESHASLP